MEQDITKTQGFSTPVRSLCVFVCVLLMCLPAESLAVNHADMPLLNRIFNYEKNFNKSDLEGLTTDVYIKRDFNVWRRNFMLWLIPSMYSIAEGDRNYLSESFETHKFNSVSDYESHCKLSFSTIRHNRYTMPVTAEFLTPDLYGTYLFGDHILSPFNKNNRIYYQYRFRPINAHTVTIHFKPRWLKNTQLVSGDADVDVSTGRIIKVKLNGEYDMMRFHLETKQGDSGIRSLLPKWCSTFLVFKFIGNQVYFNNEAIFDCDVHLPDSLDDVFDPAMVDSLRPIPLKEREQELFDRWVENHKPDTTTVTDTIKHFNFAKNVLQDAIGDNLISSIRFESDKARMKMSPILDPQYVSYSSTHGFAYKIKMGAYLKFDEFHNLEFQPWCGYNFKYKKFYFTLPLYFNYKPERHGQLSIAYGNGNRIGNSSIIDEIRKEHNDTLSLDDNQLDYFDDNYLSVSNNYMVAKGLDVAIGFTYHHRVPYRPYEFWHYGKPQSYNTFAPMISVKLEPWKGGPILSADYERGLNHVFNADFDYERWEFDGSWKFILSPLRKMNFKGGAGFYTRKKDTYFVDYMHFRDNKLPGGWDDDWSGEFQLLNSDWYNESRYYVRAHTSYESPFLMASWLPLLGHLVEKERIYISALSIDDTRPYYELGYGFSTRFISIGLFSSYLGTEFQRIDCKFTFELFRRW